MCVIMFGGLYRCEGGGYWIIPYIYKAVHNPYHASMSRGDRAVASGNLSLSMRNNYDELGVDEVKVDPQLRPSFKAKSNEVLQKSGGNLS